MGQHDTPAAAYLQSHTSEMSNLRNSSSSDFHQLQDSLYSNILTSSPSTEPASDINQGNTPPASAAVIAAVGDVLRANRLRNKQDVQVVKQWLSLICTEMLPGTKWQPIFDAIQAQLAPQQAKRAVESVCLSVRLCPPEQARDDLKVNKSVVAIKRDPSNWCEIQCTLPFDWHRCRRALHQLRRSNDRWEYRFKTGRLQGFTVQLSGEYGDFVTPTATDIDLILSYSIDSEWCIIG